MDAASPSKGLSMGRSGKSYLSEKTEANNTPRCRRVLIPRATFGVLCVFGTNGAVKTVRKLQGKHSRIRAVGAAAGILMALFYSGIDSVCLSQIGNPFC